MRIVAVVAIAASLSACRVPAASSEQPARIVEPTQQSRAELQQVVSRALGGIDVKLADDALTHSSVLIVEPAPHRDTNGNRINGRQLGVPIRFELLKDGGACVLQLPNTSQRWTLAATNCVAE